MKGNCAFLLSTPHVFNSQRGLHAQQHKCSSISVGTMMSASKGGFGKKPPSRPKSSTQQRRDSAASRYDEMAAAGMPEYSVWMRLKEGGGAEEGDRMPWLPVGCISVPRSSQVADALFNVEEDLMQGAERLYPKLKNEERDNIEFGYQLRDFDDEEIRIAERPIKGGVMGFMTNLVRSIQNPMKQ